MELLRKLLFYEKSLKSLKIYCFTAVKKPNGNDLVISITCGNFSV